MHLEVKLFLFLEFEFLPAIGNNLSYDEKIYDRYIIYMIFRKLVSLNLVWFSSVQNLRDFAREAISPYIDGVTYTFS